MHAIDRPPANVRLAPLEPPAPGPSTDHHGTTASAMNTATTRIPARHDDAWRGAAIRDR